MRNGRKARVRISAAVGSCLALGIGLAPSGSVAAPDDPSIQEVQRKVDEAYQAAERASERYNELSERMKDARSQVTTLRADVERQRHVVDEVRERLGATIASRLTTSPMGPTAQLLSSDDPDEFLDGLSALQSFNSQQSDLLASFQEKADEYQFRQERLNSKVAGIKKSKKALAEQQAALEENAADAERLLDELTREQRNAVTGSTSRAGSRADVGTVNASGRAGQAVDFAIAQLGDPYAYGAVGPDSWDCSGLTMAAWGAAGVSLPHSSSAQASMGSPVSTSAISPGDLVFYYSPISHVGIYLGDGKLVHAPHPGSNVEVVPVDSMPIATVRRVR